MCLSEKSVDMNDVYDFIGIGLGPFNLSLAAMSDDSGINSLFLDEKDGFDWHRGMMISGVTLQTPFMCDLVTMADPSSQYSFLNYKKKVGELYSFYIKEDFYLLREEYNQYCQWVVSKLSNTRWSERVESVFYDEASAIFSVEFVNTHTGAKNTAKTKHLVLGTGPTPYVPDFVKPYAEQSKIVLHTKNYLYRKKAIQHSKNITVLGSGQSAAEVFYDLLQDVDSIGYKLNWVTRSPRFYPIELTKLTLELTSPEYADYFYNLPYEKKQALNNSQVTLYKAVNAELIDEIHKTLYKKSIESKQNPSKQFDVQMLTNSALVGMSVDPASGMTLEFENQELNQRYDLPTDALIMGTGFKYIEPDFLKPIKHQIKYFENGLYDVSRNYTIDKDEQRIFVQNAELHTHGFVSPDLGMACYRNCQIINAIKREEVYPIESNTVFQTFGVPE